MIMNHLDLNYLGVFDVWTGDLGRFTFFTSAKTVQRLG